MALAVCLCLAAAVCSDRLAPNANEKGLTMEYESALFDTGEVIRINIVMEEDDWNEMLDRIAARRRSVNITAVMWKLTAKPFTVWAYAPRETQALPP